MTKNQKLNKHSSTINKHKEHRKCSPQKIPIDIELSPEIDICVNKPHIRIKNYKCKSKCNSKDKSKQKCKSKHKYRYKQKCKSKHKSKSKCKSKHKSKCKSKHKYRYKQKCKSYYDDDDVNVF